MQLIYIQMSRLHKGIGHPCFHSRPNSASEPIQLQWGQSRWHEFTVKLADLGFLSPKRLMNEKKALSCVIGLIPPQRLCWRLPHVSCIAPLGLHQGGCRRTSPFALHLTALLSGRDLKVLFEWKSAALTLPRGACGQYQMFSQNAWRSRISWLTVIQGLCNVVRGGSRTLGHMLLSACTARRGMDRHK